MSAVMSTLSIISGGRRAHRKLVATSGRKSGQYSDAGGGEDRGRSKHELKQQRSASLQTLETTPGGGVVNFESLEAKMASIEVSLAGSRRVRAAAGPHREHGRELETLRTALEDKESLIQSLKKQLSASLSAARLAGSPGASGQEAGALSADERRALEERAAAVRADLDGRRNNIAELRRRLDRTHVTENIDTRIQQAELQYKVGREELELLTLSEQARVLHALIEQSDAASAERDRTTLYSTIRECGGRATVVCTEGREGAWGFALRPGSGLYVEWTRDRSAAAAKPGDRILEVNGISMLSSRSQEELQRALSSGPAPARLVLLRTPIATHAQSTPTPFLTQSDANSLRSELGGLRAAAERAERVKEGLRTDNTRLTHRISYLEEQVAELLARHAQIHPVNCDESRLKSTVNKSNKNVTNISITSEPQHNNKSSSKSEVQVFQKGPDITAIVAKLPGLEAGETHLPVLRPRSNASGASSRMTVSPRASPAPQRRSHSSHSVDHRGGARMRHSLSHHCIHGAVDYHAETDAAIRLIERNQRHIEKRRLESERLGRCASDDRLRSDSDADLGESRSCVDRDVGKAADRMEQSIKKTNWAERKTLSIIEQLKRSQRLRKSKKNESAEDVQPESERHRMYRRIDGKVLENAHKSSRRSSKLHPRSAKSSEFESECSDYPNGDVHCGSPRIDYGSETGSAKLGYYRKNDDRPDGEARSRPTPPRKPLRLSLHKARSAHSLMDGGESETSTPAPQESQGKKPVKRTHAGAGDRWSREKLRDVGKATPRPTRKLLNGFSACETPAADDLYPESGLSYDSREKWC